jgi:CRP/FNR family transcriptional regulator, cyclic AMP receptor protein
MQRVDELIEQASALGGLEPAHRSQIAGCASNRVFAAGEQIMREGDPADAFYVIRAGAVALETAVPGRGPVTLQTLHDGDILGWSWLVAPHRTAFDARALGTTHAIAFDGACLRGRCESDPGLGYDLLKLVASVLSERLQDTRLRLLDLYGRGGRA